jgi:hypothetical protein
MKDDDQKMFIPPLGIDSKIFSSRLCQSVYDVKQKAQLEPCAPLAVKDPNSQLLYEVVM